MLSKQSSQEGASQNQGGMSATSTPLKETTSSPHNSLEWLIWKPNAVLNTLLTAHDHLRILPVGAYFLSNSLCLTNRKFIYAH